MMRPIRSEPPPGALVATISTGFSGFQSCAAAAAEVMHSSRPPISRAGRR
jgi:hypothetical protein